MKISTVELLPVKMKLVSPFTTSFGTSSYKHAILVKIHEENGIIGWGESAVEIDPLYSEDTLMGAYYIQKKYLIPALLKKETIMHPKELEAVFKHIKGNTFAKAGIEAAIWDLFAKSEKIPLAKALGGQKRKIPVGISLGINKMEILLQKIEHALNQGYLKIKIKIKPGWDINPVKEIRKAFGDIPLMVDANAAYPPTTASMKKLGELDKYELMMIEQPFEKDEWLAHKELKSRITTPICLDESIRSPAEAKLAIEIGACDIINIKVGRVGGLNAAIKIHDLAMERHVPVWCGGMLETGVGRLINIALASLPNFKYPGDISASKRYFHQDIIDPEVHVENDGHIAVNWEAPGIGRNVLEKRIREKEFEIEKEFLSYFKS